MTHSAPAASRTDAELVEQIAGGSVGAFEQLYDRYSGRAYRVARSICRDDARAQDAVQDAFTSVWRSGAATYRPECGAAAAWLMTVIRHQAIDLVRRDASHASRRDDPRMLMACCSPVDVADEAVARADAPGLRAQLARLPAAQKEVIVLAFYGQMTHAEIATHLGLPRGTVKGRMRMGLHKLRDLQHAA